MAFQEVDCLGARFIGPDEHCCILLRGNDSGRILPIWVTYHDVMPMVMRDSGYIPNRPQKYDIFSDLLFQQDGVGLEEIRISSYYQGVFIASIVLSDGREFDARPVDAIGFAQHVLGRIVVDEEVMQQASIFISDDDMQRYFEIYPEPSKKSVPVPDSDEDFQALLSEMGIREEDLELGDLGSELPDIDDFPGLDEDKN
ncbi:Uncharacterised ACR, COG1259 [Corynebacterium kutscheri]|uniref:BFN domain-containing protein n=1 Tax=Corynebacterium kutscheri TaxID=35755 RepID=A0A0F6TDE2_9CORY|nr:bifunctional nuclease family protein [Corynebacterium kutscheri]AKE41171.1 hypothetical protein UL82_04975 [Corynebacterium kutscheri]VEH09493.1 Uncharacterised ACR, COG1259 [Corynebacterium kutscheri]VEH79576.1 Uncharacterised ACR, COG1259 [Corynebacterium kutscheri]